MKYYKRLDVLNNVVGLGYTDSGFTNNMLFQMFEECKNYIQEEIDSSEFMELGIEYGFEGMKPSHSIIPGEYFPENLN